MKSSNRVVVFVVVFVLIIVFLARRAATFQFITLPEIISWVDYARAHAELKFLFYLLFVFGIMLLPITLFPIIGGVLFEFSWALPLNLLAATLGASFSFLASRYLGRGWIHRYLTGRWKMADHFAAQQGFKSVLFLRLLGFPPFLVTNYGLGLTAVRFRDFVGGTVIGILPWMAVMTYAAQSLWQAAQVGGEQGFRSALVELIAPFTVISAVVLLTTLFGFFRKKKKTNYSNL